MTEQPKPVIRAVLRWNKNDEAMYRGYRIDRLHPIDREIYGEDACYIRKIDPEDKSVGYWVELRSRYGCGAVLFPTVAMAQDLIDYWKEKDKLVDECFTPADL